VRLFVFTHGMRALPNNRVESIRPLRRGFEFRGVVMPARRPKHQL